MAIFSWLKNKKDRKDINRDGVNDSDSAAPVLQDALVQQMPAELVQHDAPVESVQSDEPVAPPVASTAPVVPIQQKEKTGLFSLLKQGLQRTRANFTAGLGRIFLGKKVIDNDLLEELETLLLSADVGVSVTRDIVKNLTDRVARRELDNPEALFSALQSLLCEIIEPYSVPLQISETSKPQDAAVVPVVAVSPYVILLVGVNGSGKTTTIGKLAKLLQTQNKKVLLAAGDTFRAAAIEQLKIWGERNNIAVIAQQSGADSAAVIYDALQAARARNIDVLIADTAGRLHTQDNLMEELKKIKRILQKLDPTAPHEVLLVLDASIGQNAINQAKQFNETIGVTGLCITKLDGTAKGGIIFAIAQQMKLPIRFIGVGEKIDDLKPFVAKDFVAALFDKS